MKQQTWAEREVNIAIEKEKCDYSTGCYKSALKAFKSLCEDGHSGFSIHATKHILNKLINNEPLTMIEDTPDVWFETPSIENGGYVSYQCLRKTSLFKDVYDDGRVEYSDVNRVICYDVDNPTCGYTNGYIRKIIDEMYPITFPYSGDEIIKVYCEDFLVYPENGDYDTKGILYAVVGGDAAVDIDIYSHEIDGEMQPITKEEYIELKKKRIN